MAAFDQEINRLKDLRAADQNAVREQWKAPLTPDDRAMLERLGVQPVENQPVPENQPVKPSQPAHEGGGLGYGESLDLVDNPIQAAKQLDYQTEMKSLNSMSPAELEAWLAKNFPADGK